MTDPADTLYNGKEQKQPISVKDTVTNKVLGEDDIVITYTGDTTNAGEVTVTVTAKPDSGYTGSFTRTYKINPRNVTLTSASASKVYDGEALTNDEVKVSGDGFVDGEGAAYDVTEARRM